MTSPLAPICLSCIHLEGNAIELDLEGGRPSCAAFPDGIPARIWNLNDDHRFPSRGDRGIQFEQDPSQPTLPAAAYDAVLE